MKKRNWIVLGYGGGLVLGCILWRVNPTVGGILLAAGLVYLLVGI